MPESLTRSIPDANHQDAQMQFRRIAAGSFEVKYLVPRVYSDGKTDMFEGTSTLEAAVTAGIITSTQRTQLLNALGALRDWLRPAVLQP